MVERWKDVVGYEGWYQVSDQGRVRRVRPANCTHVGRILKPNRVGAKHRTQYLTAHLCVHGQRHIRYIAHLVLEAFVGPCPVGEEANHINDNAQDNRLCNLKWDTHEENVQQAYRARKKRGGPTKPLLTDHQVKEVRQLHAEGASMNSLAAQFDVEPRTISNMVTGRTRTLIPVPRACVVTSAE